jgi:hypothetical protein
MFFRDGMIMKRQLLPMGALLSLFLLSLSALALTITQAQTRPTVNSASRTTAVTIDGTLSAGEWDDATLIDISMGADQATAYFKNDASYLYVAIDGVFDPTFQGQTGTWWDEVRLIFDTGNDLDMATGWVVRFGPPADPGVPVLLDIYGACSGDWFESGSGAANDSSGHVQYELQIPLSYNGSDVIGDPGDSAGLVVRVADHCAFGGCANVILFPASAQLPAYLNFQCSGTEPGADSWAILTLATSGFATETATSTPTNTPTSTATNTPTPTSTSTSTPTPTSTSTPTPTPTPTSTSTPTPTPTPTNTPMPATGALSLYIDADHYGGLGSGDSVKAYVQRSGSGAWSFIGQGQATSGHPYYCYIETSTNTFNPRVDKLKLQIVDTDSDNNLDDFRAYRVAFWGDPGDGTTWGPLAEYECNVDLGDSGGSSASEILFGSDEFDHRTSFRLVFVPIQKTGRDWWSDPYDVDDTAAEMGQVLVDAFPQLTACNTRFVSVHQVLELDFATANYSDYQLFNQFDAISTHAISQYQSGDRYVGVVNAEIWQDQSCTLWICSPTDDVEGLTRINIHQMIVESKDYTDLEVTAHEVGHTFGLCDEYNPCTWTNQDNRLTGGCPNSWPTECTDTACAVNCDGRSVNGGKCIMGPAGIPDDRAFCSECETALTSAVATQWQPDVPAAAVVTIRFDHQADSGTVQGIRFLRGRAKAVPDGVSGRYRVQLTAGGTVLYETALTPDFYTVIEGAGKAAWQEGGPLDRVEISLVVPTTLGGDDRFEDRTLTVEDLATGHVLAAWTLGPDADADGVPDTDDHCPGTRFGCRVNALGCAPDIDRDGFCDALDPVIDTRYIFLPR